MQDSARTHRSAPRLPVRRLAAAFVAAVAVAPLASAIAPDGLGATSGAATGPVATAVIVGTFSDSGGQVDVNAIRANFEGNPGSDVKSYFAEASYGKMSVVPSFFGPYTLPVTQSSGCNSRPAQALLEAAAADVRFADYSRLVFVYNCPGSNFGSATRVGPVSTPQGTVQAAQITLDAGSASEVWSVAHEISHTLGDFNGHAAFYVCLPETFVAPSQFGADDECVSSEYGDPFDTLGSPPSGKSAHLGPTHKANAGWLTAAQFPTVTQSGTFTLAPYEQSSPTQPLALNIPRGASGTAFTVEYRRPLGFDAWLGDPAVCRDCTVTQGASIRLVKGGGGSGGGSDTQLLDTTPGTIASTSFYPVDDARDGALLPGRTFTDPELGITITTLSASSSGLTVRVTIPDHACVRGTPTVSAATPASRTSSFGSAGTYTLTLTNGDGAGCSANTFRFFASSSSTVDVVASPDLVTLAPGASTTVTLSATAQALTTAGSYAVAGAFRSNSLGTGDAAVTGLTYVLDAGQDTSAPTAPAGLTAQALGSGSAGLSWSPSSDNTGVVGYRVSRGGIFKTVAGSPFVDGPLSPGTTYSYSVQAFDRRGNLSPAATVSVTTPAKTDTTAPTAPVVTAAAGDHNLSVSWTAGRDNVGIAYYRITPCFVPACTVPAGVRSFTVGGLPTQTRLDLQVMAVDGDGNSSSIGAGTYTVYTAAAGTAAPSQPSRLLSTSGSFGRIELSWTASTDDNGVAAYAVYRNNRRIATVTSTSYVDRLAACPSQYYVQAIDGDGSLSAPSTRFWFPAPYSASSDASPPTGEIVSPAGGATVSGTVDLTASASDDVKVTSVQLYVDGFLLTSRTSAPYTFAWDTSGLTNGSHWLYVRAVDAAGNYGTGSITGVTVQNAGGSDETPPRVEIVEPGSGATVSGQVSVSAEATDDVGVTRVDIAVDGTTLASPTHAPFTATWDAASAAPGPHSVTATARDAAGNTATAAVTVWRPLPADTTPPLVAITAPGNGATVSGSIQVQATATDNVAVTRAELAVDGTSVRTLSAAPWTFPLEATALGGGNHTLRVTAHDGAGNSGSAEILVTVKTDTSAPSKPGAPRLSIAGTTQLALYWTASTDNVGVGSYDVYRGGRLVASTATPSFVDDGLSPATAYAYTVVARDAAGNASATSSALSTKTLSPATGTTGTVAGLAFDPQGKALANVVVRLTVGTTVKSTKTSSSGVWKLSSIPAGDYALTAALTGFHIATPVVTSIPRYTTLTVLTLSR